MEQQDNHTSIKRVQYLYRRHLYIHQCHLEFHYNPVKEIIVERENILKRDLSIITINENGLVTSRKSIHFLMGGTI